MPATTTTRPVRTTTCGCNCKQTCSGKEEGLLDEDSVPVAYLRERLRCAHGTLCCELRNQVPSIGKRIAEAHSRNNEADLSYVEASEV